MQDSWLARMFRVTPKNLAWSQTFSLINNWGFCNSKFLQYFPSWKEWLSVVDAYKHPYNQYCWHEIHHIIKSLPHPINLYSYPNSPMNSLIHLLWSMQCCCSWMKLLCSVILGILQFQKPQRIYPLPSSIFLSSILCTHLQNSIRPDLSLPKAKNSPCLNPK